jgi:hypothetical protein
MLQSERAVFLRGGCRGRLWSKEIGVQAGGKTVGSLMGVEYQGDLNVSAAMDFTGPVRIQNGPTVNGRIMDN